MCLLFQGGDAFGTSWPRPKPLPFQRIQLTFDTRATALLDGVGQGEPVVSKLC